MASVAFCTRCGTPRGDSPRFCRACGFGLESVPPRTEGPGATREGAATPDGASAIAASPNGAAGSGPAPAPASSWQPRPTAPTPTLDQYGRDLTRQASERLLNTIVGRDAEIELVIETLCRSQKRNPALVGPAGTGKTAIVEGLAERIVAGRVPAILAGARVVQLSPSTLVAGAGIVGELETRMKAILAEAAQDGLFLFIDEVHSIVATGGARGTGDIASLLKPALARGDIACIAATTDDEYRQFIESDEALERRFSPVRIHELDAAETLEVLGAHRDDLIRLRGVTVADDVLAWLVDFARRAMPNRRFPDKGIDLVEQCVASAVAHGGTTVSRADAEAVVRRMVGIPTSEEAAIAGLERDLVARHLAGEAEARSLADRLRVTLRGLDARPVRPNAVILIHGDAAARADELCETLSQALLGSPTRVVSIDLGQMGEGHDTTLLLGAPPGYVGYDESLPIHEIAQMPWSVVRLDDVAAAHPRIRSLIADALDLGFITDATGRRIYLSDTLVVLVVNGASETRTRIGFGAHESASGTGETADASRGQASRALGPELAGQIDVVVRGPAGSGDVRRWLEDVVLAGVRARFADRGIALEWDASLVDWLAIQRTGQPDVRAWERLVDETIGSRLALMLERGARAEPGRERRVIVRVVGGSVDVKEASETTA